ncbi:MAG: glycosyltransferase [Lachnospiraceae bacterium]|nr:glycosyltransferase [Lachnospiraceae bacterium]
MSALSFYAKKAGRVLKNEGLFIVLYKVYKRLCGNTTYRDWIAGNELNLTSAERFDYEPLISVVIPVYNVDSQMLRDCINSVLAQTYRNFEIILVDDASTMDSVRTVLAEYDPELATANSIGQNSTIPLEDRQKVKVIYRTSNGHISRSTNDGIEAASGEFVALCDCDDLFSVNALYEMVKLLNQDRTLDYIYSDEDKVDETGKVRRDPFFKPDWSPETFMSLNYTCHLSMYRKSILDQVGGLRVGLEGSQDYDLVLRVMEVTNRIGHVPKILYHWRMRKESTASAMTAKPYVLEATEKAKRDALERRGLIADLSWIDEVTMLRVTYQPQNHPLVSIVIPSKDNVKVLFQCLDSIVEKTKYQNYELVIVDNGSNDENRSTIEGKVKELQGKNIATTYIYEKEEFNFSAMCNRGAKASRGELLLFLNDDIEISSKAEESPYVSAHCEDWLSILAGQAQVSYTGAVGCKLFYPNSIRFQHAGVLNLQIGPGHCLYGSNDNLNYYYGRNILVYNYTVITGACLMVEAEKFWKVGGFDETFPVAYNDVDLCFRLVKAGFYNVCRSDLALVHHESVSRGLDEKSIAKEERRKREMARLYEKNPEFKDGYDPCYNPNLTYDKGDFSFDLSHAYEPMRAIKCPKDLPAYVRDTEKEPKLRYAIESAKLEKDDLCMGGWAYRTYKKDNNHIHTTILLRNESGDTYRLKTRRKYRFDVSRPEDGSIRGLGLVGWETRTMTKKLPAGRYRIGVSIDKVYSYSDTYVDVVHS